MAEQLRMFMTPHEIMQQYKPNPPDFFKGVSVVKDGKSTTRTETNEEFWARKGEEADDVRLTDSIKEGGVKMPISLDPATRTIRGGHHRLAVAHRLNPHQFVPVMHVGTVKEAGKAEEDISRHADDDDVTDWWGYY